jgi:hypothetical protein
VSEVARLSPNGGEVILMMINGTQYYADDVSDVMVIQNPGYSYFPNGSITFMGVKFETICPPEYSGCSHSNGGITMSAGAIGFNMTWQQDKSSERAGGVLGDLTYVYFLSQRYGPRAGILMEYVSSASPPHKCFPLGAEPKLSLGRSALCLYSPNVPRLHS